MRTDEFKKLFGNLELAVKIELLDGQYEDVTMTPSRNFNNSISVAKLLNNVDKSNNRGQEITKTPQSSVSITPQTPDQSVSGYKDTRLMSILQTNSSKVVDDNGEPMVVHHGTNRYGFTVFDTFYTNVGDMFTCHLWIKYQNCSMTP